MGSDKPTATTQLIGDLDKIGFRNYTVMFGGQGLLCELATSYNEEHPTKPILSKAMISEFTCLVSSTAGMTPKLWVEFKMAARLLPEIVTKRLYEDRNEGRVTFHVTDGMGSSYDATTNTIKLKGALDFIHEVGHHVWNNWLIRDDEPEKKHAVNYSLSEDQTHRKRLSNELIPNAHQKYSRLVGAYNGQFLEDPSSTGADGRGNDLEEHFARNFDFFARGRPLDVLSRSGADVDAMLRFYMGHRLSDENHARLCRHLLKKRKEAGADELGDIQVSIDGIPALSRNELYQYHKTRLELERKGPLSLYEKIGLALDLTPDFMKYCVKRKGFPVIKQALKEKGITALKLPE